MCKVELLFFRTLLELMTLSGTAAAVCLDGISLAALDEEDRHQEHSWSAHLLASLSPHPSPSLYLRFLPSVIPKARLKLIMYKELRLAHAVPTRLDCR